MRADLPTDVFSCIDESHCRDVDRDELRNTDIDEIKHHICNRVGECSVRGVALEIALECPRQLSEDHGHKRQSSTGSDGADGTDEHDYEIVSGAIAVECLPSALGVGDVDLSFEDLCFIGREVGVEVFFLRLNFHDMRIETCYSGGIVLGGGGVPFILFESRFMLGG